MTYGGRVLALTPDFAKLSISPESSDGFASVGTILPKEEATLLPGGLFVFLEGAGEGFGGRFPNRNSQREEMSAKGAEDDEAADGGRVRRAWKLSDERGRPDVFQLRPSDSHPAP
jgi:hypothetical protein